MRVKSFAKVNLGIEVLGKRGDGYHEIRTIFQSIDLCDHLEFIPLPHKEIVVKGNIASIPWDKSNLIHRAAALLKERCASEMGVEVRVKKKIPAGRGLGGGSSNAAMTLWALNKLWVLGLEKQELKAMGALLGADVPFFFEGGLCLGQGRGDRVVPLEDLNPYPCVLVLPSFSVSTASVYEGIRVTLTSQDKDSKIIRFLDSRDLGFLDNDLEETVFRTHPQIKAIKRTIQEQDSELTLMSGSGSAVFGLFRQKDQAENVLRRLSKKYSAVLTTTLSRAEYWRKIQTGV